MYWITVRRQCKGECYLIRYCDDFVCCFQNQYEAQVFRQRLEERFRKYGLELAEEKTKILDLGGLPGKTEKQEEKENKILMTSLVSRFIAEWTERSSFSVVG